MPAGVNAAGPGESADASGSAAVRALTRRLSAYVDGGDPALVLEPAAEAEAVTVLEFCVRETFRTQQVDVQARLGQLALTGMLFYLRLLLPDEENPRRDRDLHLGVALFSPMCDADPDAVPSVIADHVPKSGREGEPQIENWSGYSSLLLDTTHRADRTALFAALAVLQLGLAMSQSQSHRTLCLGNLNLALTWLYELCVDAEALSTATVLGRWLVAETQDEALEHARALAQLSNTLRYVYAQGRDPKVLAEAIALAREATGSLPRDHPSYTSCRVTLSHLLRSRHADQGDSGALREVVSLWRAVIADLPPHSPRRAEALAELAKGLADLVTLNAGGRHDRQARSLTLLDEIVALSRAALAAYEAHHPDDADLHPALLADLSRHLCRRADLIRLERPRETEKATGDLEEALRLARQARQAAPDPHGRGNAQGALIDALSSQYDRDGDPAVLAEAITLAREGVMAADGDPRKLAASSFTLGALLNNRYADIGNAADAVEGAAVLRTVAGSSAAAIRTRLDGAWNAGKLAISQEEWSSAAEDLSLAVRLLPKLAEFELRDSDKERQLAEYGHLPTLAAECALTAGRPELAIELLEQGRCVLYAETAAIRASSLTPPGLPEILSACDRGPVAIPLLGRYRAAALLVTSDGVRRVPLPLLTFESVRRMADNILTGVEQALDQPSSPSDRMMGEYSLRAGLAQLWDAVVRPVLDALRDEASIRARGGLGGADPPRMWWCPTGPLSFFPFHMAARHEEGDAFELVLSSYTPTVHALGGADTWRPAKDSRPLVVALPRTPGAADLPSADQEAAAITTIFPDTRLLRGRAATRGNVTAALPGHDILHVACHSGHDTHRGYEGHLVLFDGRMHIADIVTMRTGREAGLAFLSACGTARGRVDLPDESLSLLTAFKSAGFSHLVGSLWPVADQANSRLVENFYSALTTNTSNSVAAALHHAVRRLRDHAPDRPSLWAPHQHIGP